MATRIEITSSAALQNLRMQAPRLCEEAGVRLPACLLSDGVPSSPTTKAAANAEQLSLDDLIEAWINDHPDRKGAGLYLTPPRVALDLLTKASSDGFTPRSVLDPSVGAGVFLDQAMILFGPEVALYGVDNDPFAVAATRLRLWLRAAELGGSLYDPRLLINRIICADALFDTRVWKDLLPSPGIDLVCGNPPFGNAIEKRTGRSSEEKRFLKDEFPESACGPYDRSVIFVQLSARALAKNGRLALLVPRALLAARYAGGLREWMTNDVPLTDIVLHRDHAPVPTAQIAMVGWLARRGEGAQHVTVRPPDGGKPRPMPRECLDRPTWGGLLHPLSDALEASARLHPLIGDSFVVRSGASVGEAYKMVGELQEGGDGRRFLTSGLLTRYGDRWGDMQARHLGRKLMQPVLPDDASTVSESRRALYAAPKIVVAGLSRRLKARCDEKGDYAAGVGTLLVVPRKEDAMSLRLLRRGSLFLNSAYLSELHRSRNGPMSLSGGNLPLGRRDIEEFPFPECLEQPAARISRAVVEHHLETPDDVLPAEPSKLLAILDVGYNALSTADHVDGWDAIVQRVILQLVGCDSSTAGAILKTWSQ